MIKNELKPCPFCGRKVEKERGYLTSLTMFLCLKCGATVSFQSAEKDPKATEKWNRRQ